MSVNRLPVNEKSTSWHAVSKLRLSKTRSRSMMLLLWPAETGNKAMPEIMKSENLNTCLTQTTCQHFLASPYDLPSWMRTADGDSNLIFLSASVNNLFIVFNLTSSSLMYPTEIILSCKSTSSIKALGALIFSHPRKGAVITVDSRCSAQFLRNLVGASEDKHLVLELLSQRSFTFLTDFKPV